MSSGAASAPGSSANLGPGFDVVAIAWEMRCRAEVSRADRWLVRQDGREWSPRPDEFVKRAAEKVSPGPFVVDLENAIPRSRGLGSSSAVAASIAAASARAAGIELAPAELLRLVADLEGHPDNAAAAVLGGVVLVDATGFTTLELAPGLRFVAAIPDAPLRTSEARAALSASVSREIAVRSLSRFGFLIEGLRSGDPDLLARARGDELHEEPRAGLSPVSGLLVSAALDAGAYHAAWSGAGPTVLAITDDRGAGEVEAALAKVLDEGGEVRPLVPASSGVL